MKKINLHSWVFYHIFSITAPCFLEPDAGMCYAYFTYWYYNHQTGSCAEFIYGGCAGNGNKFETQEECMARCHP